MCWKEENLKNSTNRTKTRTLNWSPLCLSLTIIMTYENNSDVLIKTSNNDVQILPKNNADKINVCDKKNVHEPPDGGFYAYLIMICAFMCNGILFGIINSYSVIYLSLQRQLKDSGDELASSKACKLIYVYRWYLWEWMQVQFLGSPI